MKNSVWLCVVLTLLLICLFIQMTEMKYKKKEKKMIFECGFNPITLKKMAFSTNFLLMAMMFLIFDVEVSILIPFIMANKNTSKNIMLTMAIFIALLTLLMLKEWVQGSLEWNQ